MFWKLYLKNKLATNIFEELSLELSLLESLHVPIAIFLQKTFNGY